MFGGCIIFNCRKEKINSHLDYRSNFTGKYKTKYQVSCYGPCWTCNTVKDTIISVVSAAADSSITVLGRTFKIDISGEYYSYHYGLTFRHDSIFSTYMNGGLGCGAYETYIGYRISK